jgi:threonine dehydratase
MIDIDSISKNISPYIHKTPVLTSRLINKIAGCNIFFKCENFQKMGAFKMRGAINAILNLSEEQRKHGVVTHSSGNFAQALALAANLFSIKAYIVMPTSAPLTKQEAVRSYGGEIILCPPTLKDRENYANEIVLLKRATFLHPSNNQDVINGQGTAALELLNDYPDLDAIFVPVGGGGLLAGTILARNQKAPNCLIFAGEPSNADDAFRSIKSKRIESNSSTNTIADGLKTELGEINFPIILDGVEEIILVSENEIMESLKLIWSRLKVVIEPSSAVAFAALLKHTSKCKNVGIILSGGNISEDLLNFKL